MKSIEFCYWLHGFDELTNGVIPTEAQWEMIKQHLAVVEDIVVFQERPYCGQFVKPYNENSLPKLDCGLQNLLPFKNYDYNGSDSLVTKTIRHTC